MSIDDLDDFELVQLVGGAVAAERALLHPAVRSSRDQVEEFLHADFTEIGASGRLWSRAEMIELLQDDDPDGEPIADSEMNATLLPPDLVLLTYVSDHSGRRARRSSIWRRTDGQWRVLFHQGTLLP